MMCHIRESSLEITSGRLGKICGGSVDNQLRKGGQTQREPNHHDMMER